MKTGDIRTQSGLRRVAVVGAGPSGLMAAIRAARDGAVVDVLERLPAPGRKLLATGGGRANISNTLSEADFVARLGRKGKFMISALRELSRGDLVGLLASWGLPCEANDGFHFFLRSGRGAADLLEALLAEAESLGVAMHYGKGVSRILTRSGRAIGVQAEGIDLPADSVILASGGAGYSALGGNRSGYELASRLGHAIVPLVPGMVGLRTRESWPGDCAGITLPDCEVRIEDRLHARDIWRGDLLFTHAGLSGPCILDASASACRRLLEVPEVRVRIGGMWRLGHEEKRWQAHIEGWRQWHGKRTVRSLLAGMMPGRLAEALCASHGIPSGRVIAEVSRDMQKRLIGMLEGPVLHVTAADGGFERAMVTSGGVALQEVHPGTLASRIVEALYFAGEILDIDGPCGGFNLQWAFSSGWLAGKNAAAFSGQAE